MLIGAGVAAVAAVVAGVLVLGGGDDGGSTTGTTSPGVVSTVAGGDDGTVAPDPSTGEVTTTSVPAAPAGAEWYDGASGWRMAIDPNWTETAVDGVEVAWYTGGGTDTFRNNIVVGTASDYGDLSMEEYLQLSRDNLSSSMPDVEFLDTLVHTDNGYAVGRMKFTADFGSGLQFTMLFVVKSGDTFVSVQYAGEPDSARTEADVIETYLRTLHPTAASTDPGTGTGTISGVLWEPGTLPAVAAAIDDAMAGIGTDYVRITIYSGNASIVVPAATPGSYESYDWLPAGTPTGPTPETVDAGTPTFTVNDLDWTAVAAQVTAAPSLVGLENGSVVYVVVTFTVTGTIEGVSATVFVQDSGVVKFVRLDATGQVLVTG